ncbi:40S ribosomal protein S27-like [Hyaena hyaena]|uniref:40S ribosomal protein S27-like n=1 Tax=Hyaena hyaena TaxID=95912 RepID=UPI0019223609|nr:40S ribosomal protein S27-like [Hyaena hyaena]
MWLSVPCRRRGPSLDGCQRAQRSFRGRVVDVTKVVCLFPAVTTSPREHAQRLVQSPSCCFVDVKCLGSYKIATVFSRAQTVILCVGFPTVLCRPKGGKLRLTEGCSFGRKQH